MKAYLLYIRRDYGDNVKLVKIFATLEMALEMKNSLEQARDILDIQDLEVEIEEREVELELRPITRTQ